MAGGVHEDPLLFDPSRVPPASRFPPVSPPPPPPPASSLWTPDGERPVGRATPSAEAETPADTAEAPLDPEQEARAREMAHELSEARRQVLEAEVSTVLTNHALGIYELAALHLTADDPDLAEARLAIDALGALVEGLEGRLGDGEATLVEGLANIKMAFVQRVNQQRAAGEPGADDADSGTA